MANKFAPGWILTTCVAMALGVLLWLGFWQLDRLEEKTAFLAQIETALKGEPEDLIQDIEKHSDWEYRKVNIAGTVNEQRYYCIFGRKHDGEMGLFYLLPVMVENEKIILVNAGWNALTDMGKVICPSTKVTIQELTAVGIVRYPHENNAFTPEADVENRVWYKLDILSMDKVDPAITLSPMLLDNASINGADAVETYMPLSVPNDHMQYAMTWFGLAVMLLGVYIVFGMQRARKKLEV